MNEGQLWMTIGADNTQFAKAANDTNKRLNDMSNNVKAFTNGIKSSFVEAAKQMAGFYSVAKAGTMFEELIQKNDAFNKSMKEVSTLSDDVAKNLDSYKKQILDMTTKIPIAADDAAKALYQINSAGHTGADGMMVLEASAKAAIGGVTDTATAADTITTVLNAYKMSSSEAAAVSDKLFTAVRLGKTTMSELGASIAQVAPMAATYGISIDQVLAAVATLTKNGTPTAQAFTQIRASIVSMADAMGATYFQTHTLQEGMVALREAVPDNNKLKDVMGRIEGVNAVLAMTGKNAAGAASDLQEFQASAGAAGDAYDKMNSGKGVELTKLQNNIMAEMADLNNEISATIASLAHSLNEAFDSGNIDNYVKSLEALIAAYGVYKAYAIAVSAAQATKAAIISSSQAEEMTQLQQVISMKEAEVTADGQVVVSEKAEVTEREAGIIAARKEAKAVLDNIKAKAEEAAITLENAKAQEAFAESRVAAAQQSIAMREQELAAAEASGDMLKVEAAENELNAAALEQQDAARALSTAQRKTEEAQIAATNTAKVLETTTTIADTAATTGDTVATGLLGKAKVALAAAIDKVAAAMAANPWTVAAAAALALGYALYDVNKKLEESAEKQRKYQQQIYNTTHAGEGLKKSLEALRKDALSKQKEEVADVESKYFTLRSQWNALGNDLNKKKKFVTDNKDAFHALGFEVDSVSDAENLLVKNTDAVVAAMEARAKAAAYQELMTESYKKKIQAEQNVKKNTSGYRNAFQGGKTLSYDQLGQDEKDYLSSALKNGTIKSITKAGGNNKYGVTQRVLTDEAAKALNARNNNKVINRRNQALKNIDDASDKEIKALEDDAKASAEDAKKKLKAAGVKEYNGSTEKANIKTDDKKGSGKTAAQTAAEVKQEQADLLALLDKQSLERQRKEQDMADKLVEIGIKGIRDKNKKELAELQFAHEKENLELDREEEDAIAAEVQNQKEIFDKQEDVKAKGNKKYAKKTFTNDDIDQNAIKEIQSAYQAQREKTYAAQGIETAAAKTNQAKAYAQELAEYLKQYGTYEQKKEAIIAEYAQRRKDIETESPDDAAAKAQIAAEEEAALQKAAFENVKQDLDWETVFSNLDGYTTEYLESLREKLHDALNISDISAENAKIITEQLNKVTEKIGEMKSSLGNIFGEGKLMGGSWMGNIFQTLQKQNELEAKADQDKETAKQATGNAAQKQWQYQQQKDDFISQLSEKSGQSSDAINGMTTQQMGELAKQSGMTDQFASVLQSGQGAAEAAQAAQAAQGASAASSGAAAGGSGASGLAVTDAIIHGVNQNVQSMNDMVQKWDIGGDDFQEKVGKFAESSQHATAAFDSLKNGDIAGVVFNLGEAVSELGESFGIWSNSNMADVKKEDERLANALRVNSEALDRNTKKIGEGSALDANAAYQQSKQLLELSSEESRAKMLNNASMYNHGHSLNYDFNANDDNLALVQKMSRKLGVTMNSLQDVLNTDARTLEKLYDDEEGQDLLTQFTQALLDTQDNGNYNGMADDFLEYISSYGQDAFDELQDSLYEAVTGVSFDGFKDNFTSMLMDLDNDVNEFSDDFTKKLTQSFLDAQIEAKYGDEIEQLYKDWGKALDDNNELSESEIEELQARQEDLSERMIEDRDKIAELTGYDDVSSSEAQGSINGIESISDDTANELVGRMTAMQIAVENQYGTLTSALAQMTIQTNLTTQGNTYLSNILDQHALANSYLEDISKYAKQSYTEWGDKIQKIVDYTSRL